MGLDLLHLLGAKKKFHYHNVGPGLSMSTAWRRSGSQNDIVNYHLWNFVFSKESQCPATIHFFVETFRPQNHFLLK